MKPSHWRTTTLGIVTAFFAFVLFSPDTFTHWPWLIAVAKFVTAGGIAGIGIQAADKKAE